MFGSLIMFAFGSCVSSPKNFRPSDTFWSSFRLSGKAESTRPANETSDILTLMLAADVKALTIGNKEQVASDVLRR